MWRELVNLCGYHGGFINELWLFTCWAMLVRSGHYHEWVFFLINFKKNYKLYSFFQFCDGATFSDRSQEKLAKFG